MVVIIEMNIPTKCRSTTSRGTWAMSHNLPLRSGHPKYAAIYTQKKGTNVQAYLNYLDPLFIGKDEENRLSVDNTF